MYHLIFSFIILLTLIILILHYFIYKKIHKNIYIDITKFLDKFYTQFNYKEQILQNQIEILQNQIDKALFTIVLLKNFQTYSVAKTITKILETPRVLNSLEINISFLENLKEEYIYLKEGLSDQLKKHNNDIDSMQKNNINKIISELDNTILILSTISEESSPQYIEEIFKEVTASFMKIHGINNI